MACLEHTLRDDLAKPKTVAHLTSVHMPDDVRIASRECAALQHAGYRVVLVAPRGRPPRPGLPTVFVKRSRNRALRILVSPWRVLAAAVRVKADVYHVHDPELILTGLALKALRRRVIYDAHEDIAKQIAGKQWIPTALRPILSRLSAPLESLADRYFDAVIVVTPLSRRRFRTCRRVAVIRNFPLLHEFDMDVLSPPYEERDPLIAYVGAISPERGLWTMVEAVSRVAVRGVRLQLAGPISASLLADGRARNGWQRVDILGYLSRNEVREVLSRSRVGLAVLAPLPNYLDSYPTKLFEYMAAGIPSIVSDFPPWRAVIEKAGCGVVVDPGNVASVAAAISTILENPGQAAEMGMRGRRAVATEFNWDTEASALVALYRAVLERSPFRDPRAAV